MDALERAGYLAHADGDAHRGSLRAAATVIQGHPDHAVSLSWGKDSVAMLSVVSKVSPGAHVVFARYEHPAEVLGDIDAVRDAVLARPEMARMRYSEISVPGEWQIFERVGHAFVVPETALEREAVRWWRETFEVRMRAVLERLGATGWLIGMRAAESRGRSLNVATRGDSYVTAAGRATALPLARWTGLDVWARLVARHLPWLRVYDGGLDRDRARSDLTWCVGGSSGHLRHGAAARWQRAYPEQLAAWFERWPELKTASHL